jgi:hypothetical protein
MEIFIIDGGESKFVSGVSFSSGTETGLIVLVSA